MHRSRVRIGCARQEGEAAPDPAVDVGGGFQGYKPISRAMMLRWISEVPE
jgi:hypothetical protein